MGGIGHGKRSTATNDSEEATQPQRGGTAQAAGETNNVSSNTGSIGSIAAEERGEENRGALGCSFGGNTNVMDWAAPDAAQNADKVAWKNAKVDAHRTISSFNKGGKVLRDFIRKQLNVLDVLRHELFARSDD